MADISKLKINDTIYNIKDATARTTAVYISDGVTASATNNADLLEGHKASYFQSALVSGTNIKTINGTSILGSGNITIQSGIAYEVIE